MNNRTLEKSLGAQNSMNVTKGTLIEKSFNSTILFLPRKCSLCVHNALFLLRRAKKILAIVCFQRCCQKGLHFFILPPLLLVALVQLGCVQTGDKKETGSVSYSGLSWGEKESREESLLKYTMERLKTLFCPETERELWFIAEVLRNEALPYYFTIKKERDETLIITNERGRLVAKCPKSGKIEYNLPTRRKTYKGREINTFALLLEMGHFSKLNYEEGVVFDSSPAGHLDIR